MAAASVQAQTGRNLSMRDLVELSRAERARRAGQPIEGRVYTSDDIARFVPPVAARTAALGPGPQPVDEETARTMEELAQAFGRLGSDLVGSTSNLLAVGEDLSGGMIRMLEAFESEGQVELRRLESDLADPSLSAGERSQIQAEITEVQGMLSEVSVELESARQQASDFEASREDLDVLQAEIDAAERTAADREEALAAWQEQLEAKLSEIQDLEDREVRQQLSITQTRGIVTAPTGTQQERNRARTDLAVAESTLEQIRQQLAEAAAELEVLVAQEPGPDEQ